MLSLASIQPVLLPIVLGVATHLAVFIRGEWHMQAPFLFKLYALVYVGSFAVLRCFPASFNNFYLTTNTFFLYYMSGLFSSICIYRRYFHRLRHFPGPPLAGITKFWHVWQCRTGQNYLVIEKLRKKYGPVIRTGPEELTIIDAAVPSAVDGPKSKCTKAVWYDFLLPEIAVNTTRSNKEHDARRRIWDQGFSTKALAAYDERVVQYTDTLVRRIESTSQRSEAVNVSDWFYWYTFDIMGEFAFARSFSMLEEENWHFAVKLLRKAMSLLGPFSPVPWAAQIAFYIVPWMYIVRDWLAMMEWCKDRMGERIKMKVDRTDVSHWLIDASLKRGSLEADREWLNGDAVTIIIAGSDTVAPTLVFAFYELARTPEQQDILFEELKDVDIYDPIALQRCTQLNALINETLRLHPPVPTGGYRQSPPDGMVINNTYIPGNVTIVAPRYSLARLETSYERADQFIPERWTTKRDMVKDAKGFAPFSQGRFNCVGKTLAMREMRHVIAILTRKFTVSMSANEDGKRVFEDMRDQFTAAPGSLHLNFRARASPEL